MPEAQMANLSETFSFSSVQMQSMQQTSIEDRMFTMFLVVGTHTFFIHINLAMMFTLWRKLSFRHTARYILFAHMLFNDTIHLLFDMVLCILAAFYLFVVRAACAFIVFLSVSTFTVSPLHLAVMSLERYTAICFPLRHSELATPGRMLLAVGIVWVLGVINILIDVCALFFTGPSFFLSPTLCTLEQLQTAGWQQEKGVALNTLWFVMVFAVLIYTYVAIMLEARSASSSDPASARRALHTVLLHVFQLGLSLMSMLYGVLEGLLATLPLAIYTRMRFFNFFVVLVLPRCLSSLIYGLRDKAFRQALRQDYICCSVRRVGPSTKH